VIIENPGHSAGFFILREKQMGNEKDFKIIGGRGVRDVPDGMERGQGGMKPDRGVLPPIENRIPPPPSKKESK
jgi:hypothetical protein